MIPRRAIYCRTSVLSPSQPRTLQQPSIRAIRSISQIASQRWHRPRPPLIQNPSCKSSPIVSRSPLAPHLVARFNSTSTAPPALPGKADSVPSNDTSASSLEQLLELDDTGLHTSPEQIGYLKSLGLDFGWGPTSVMEWLLEHVHVYSGMPWWGSIILTSVAVRVALFKFYVSSADISARQAAMEDVIKPLQIKILQKRRMGDRQGAMEANEELRDVFKKTGIRPQVMLIPVVFQGLLGYGSFRLLRNMAQLPVPGLETGGFLWLHDLTVPDPFYVLPSLLALFLFFVIKLGGETGTVRGSAKIRRILLYLFPSVSFAVMFAQPGALQLSFVTATALGVLQGRILQNPSFRERMGIAPIIKPLSPNTKPSSSLSPTYQPPTVQSSIADVDSEPDNQERSGTISKVVRGAKKEISGVMKEAQDKMATYTGNVTGTGEVRKPRMSEQFLKEAEAYEKSRQEDLLNQRLDFKSQNEFRQFAGETPPNGKKKGRRRIPSGEADSLQV